MFEKKSMIPIHNRSSSRNGFRYDCFFVLVRYVLSYHKKHRISKENRCFSNFLAQNGEIKNEIGVSFGVSCKSAEMKYSEKPTF